MGDQSPPPVGGHRQAVTVGDGGKHSAAKAKRRTKTGCLTCRKRRIKCDEGRPTCRNCTKSKKQCEGYQTTRPQARNPGNEFPQSNVNNAFPGSLGMGELRQVYGNNPGQFPSILPRPIQHGDHQVFSPQEQSHWMQNPVTTHDIPLDPSQLSQLVAAQASMVATPAAYMSNFPSNALGAHFAQSMYTNSDGMNIPDNDASGMGIPSGMDTFPHGASLGIEHGHVPHDSSGFPMQVPNPISPEGHVWNPSIRAYDPSLYSSIPPEQFDITETLLEEELFDVGSDEEGIDALERSDRTGLPLMMSVHGNFDIKALRTHDTFLNTPNILAHYEPQWFASPLMDPTTARVFGHFIAVTACHLSLGQRRASNPSLLFQPRAVPKSQQGLWTYILPQKALSNQGLMHAMLAVASLQIAMLQGTDRHTARKHYHFAIQRNSKSVASPKKRTSIATIATTLLLAAFEVWAADHSNWNSHLLGARQLLLEADFIRMTRQIKEHKLAAAPATNPDDPYTAYLMQKAGPVLQADFPDEELLEHFMGYKVPYGNHGIETGRRTSSRPITQGDIDTHDSYADLFWFFVKQDIYYSTISSKPLLLPFERWGECPPRAPLGRIDAIYGTSDHLMLIYGRIARFINQDLARKKKAVEATGGRWRPPPGLFAGAPAGAGGATASNGSGDPARKKAAGPPPGGEMPSGMPANAFPGGANGPASPQGPDFMGMIPEMPTPRIPSAFRPNASGHAFMPAKREEEGADELSFENLDTAFKRAMAEWNGIQAALDAFERELQAPFWQPLPFQATEPLPTHFSSARQYGDYRIADIWSMFYTAKIIMARMHPSMPPAAMMAAAVCKEQTAEWANKVGQIVFGMQTPQDNDPLNPTFASVLTQNMYTLFFAGVQYQEPEQRLVCVQRLQYIAEKVGHESAALIAAALETCWINAYRMGKGPEWQRTLGLAVDKDDENRSADFRTIERTKDSTTVTLRTDSIREQFGMGIMSLDSDFDQLNMD